MVGRDHRLDEHFRFRILYEDETSFGSAVTGRCDDTIRSLCPEIVESWRQHGIRHVVAHGRELLEKAFEREGLGHVYERPGIIKESCLYPPMDQVRPVGLLVEHYGNQSVTSLPLPSSLIGELASWLGEWQQGSRPPGTAPARRLWDSLKSLGALTSAPGGSNAELGHATLVGHATVRLAGPKSSLLFDPFLLPPAPHYPEDYQPLTVSELSPPNAIFITHSHPDHFDFGSLLLFGAETPIYVPQVERESLLALGMAQRLREIGFRNVQELGWFCEAKVGDFRVIALPFYGEQPTTGEVLHAEVRNAGNIYIVEDSDRRYGVIVDSGQDYSGAVQQLAARARKDFGPLDLLFGGYRGFAMYPVHLLFSSITRYLLFVPQASWGVRQKIMNDANDLLDVGEIWDARLIIPYADGGAPWYWERGLGPRLDNTSTQTPNTAVDPPPEHVLSAARSRSGSALEGLIPSPVPVSLLRPGDSLFLDADGPRLQRSRPHAWPYQEHLLSTSS